MHVSAAIQWNIETRPSNVHIHSARITYFLNRHIARPIRLEPVSLCRVVRQCAVFGGKKGSNLVRSSPSQRRTPFNQGSPLIPSALPKETARNFPPIEYWRSIILIAFEHSVKKTSFTKRKKRSRISNVSRTLEAVSEMPDTPSYTLAATLNA